MASPQHIWTRDGYVDLSIKAKKPNLLRYLKQDQDVSKPVKRRMHPLSVSQILQMNQNNVDDLRRALPSANSLAIGPDGLTDEGSLADMGLLSSLSRENTMDAVKANAIDARHAPPASQLYALKRRNSQDMMKAANKIDTKAAEALAHVKRNTGFRMVAGVSIAKELDGRDMHDPFHELDKVHASEVHTGKDRFHATVVPTPKNTKQAQAARAEDWTAAPARTQAKSMKETTMDLGEEGPAEAMADPMPTPKADPGPGIWIEPGSNKGYDSYALDSLQVKDAA